jgi:hypothetical protein
MSRTAPLARQRRTPPLSNAWFDVPVHAADELAPGWFAPMHRDAANDARPHAPTRFVERRRHPRQPGASLGRLLERSAVAGVSHGGTWMPMAAAPMATATVAVAAMPRAAAAMRSTEEPERPVAALAAGLRRGCARVERALDRLLPSPLVTLLQLFVCISLAMAVMSLMLPLLDLR